MTRFTQDLSGILKKERIDVLCPLGIKEVLSVLREEEELRPLAAIPFGSFETIARANNKVRAIRAAMSASIPVPETVVVSDIDETRKSGIALPVVIKTAVGAGSNGVWYIDREEDWAEAEVVIQRLRTTSNKGTDLSFDPRHLLVQEFIPGEVHDVCVLVDHGHVRALLTQKRLKTSSLKGGGGIMNVTTHIPVLKDYATRLMGEIGYHGVAQLEFKHDTRDEEYKLLEINAKFWGTLGLSIAAGINFPFLAALMALNQPFKDQFDYKEGLIYRWRFPNEVLRWARERNAGVKLRSLIASPRGEIVTDWRWNDPLPSVQRILLTVWKLRSL
jgi:predicted ATP-grasp superfamily ATP-dependent carboligase